MGTETATYTKVSLPILKEKGIALTVKREELLFPHISGNKYRKLKYNMAAAKAARQHTLLTFGGAFSNHIAATAYAGKLHGFKTIGVIRGEELALKPLNPTLAKAVENGMALHFVSRAAYKKKESPLFLEALTHRFGTFYKLPEGGTNSLAIKGCAELVNAQDRRFSHLAVAVGTGGTLSGVANGAFAHQEVVGFPALKGVFLQKDICNFTTYNNWRLEHAYHFGGYAKITPTLVAFMNEFKAHTQIALDPIYTSKMVYGVLDLIKTNAFEKGSHILIIHTGGLQAIEGMNAQLTQKGLDVIQ